MPTVSSKSEIFQVTQRSSEDRYLHLIAFVTHQYSRLQDDLLDVLLNVLQTYLNTAQREHKEVCYRRREYWNEAVRKLAEPRSPSMEIEQHKPHDRKNC